MGPPTYMRSVFDRNVVTRLMTVNTDQPSRQSPAAPSWHNAVRTVCCVHLTVTITARCTVNFRATGQREGRATGHEQTARAEHRHACRKYSPPMTMRIVISQELGLIMNTTQTPSRSVSHHPSAFYIAAQRPIYQNYRNTLSAPSATVSSQRILMDAPCLKSMI